MRDLLARYPRTTLYVLTILVLLTLASRWRP